MQWILIRAHSSYIVIRDDQNEDEEDQCSSSSSNSSSSSSSSSLSHSLVLPSNVENVKDSVSEMIVASKTEEKASPQENELSDSFVPQLMSESTTAEADENVFHENASEQSKVGHGAMISSETLQTLSLWSQPEQIWSLTAPFDVCVNEINT